MLQVSRRAEYALRAVLHLARLQDGQRASFRQIAEHEDAPAEFLAKVLRNLVDAGLVHSSRGVQGGFSLARSPSAITFLEVMEAADGPIALNDCSVAGDGCAQTPFCDMAQVWRAGEAAMVDVFRKTSIAELVAGASSSNPTAHRVDAG